MRQTIFVVWDTTIPGLAQRLESLARSPSATAAFTIPSSSSRAGEILRDVVIAGIKSADRVLAIVDKPNVNVGFELGMAVGWGKPIAIVHLSPQRPEWLNLPPIANMISTAVDDVGELERVADDDALWLPADYARAPAVDTSANDSVLFLSPISGEGEGLRHMLSAELGVWRTLPPFKVALHDLPETCQGIGKVVWVITPGVASMGDRDGNENAANAIIVGWFLSLLLGTHTVQERWPVIRARVRVLRSETSRAAVDLALLESVFRSLAEAATLAKAEARAPIDHSSSKPGLRWLLRPSVGYASLLGAGALAFGVYRGCANAPSIEGNYDCFVADRRMEGCRIERQPNGPELSFNVPSDDPRFYNRIVGPLGTQSRGCYSAVVVSHYELDDGPKAAASGEILLCQTTENELSGSWRLSDENKPFRMKRL